MLNASQANFINDQDDIVLVHFVNIMVVGNIAWWTTIFSKTMDTRPFFLGSGQGRAWEY